MENQWHQTKVGVLLFRRTNRVWLSLVLFHAFINQRVSNVISIGDIYHRESNHYSEHCLMSIFYKLSFVIVMAYWMFSDRVVLFIITGVRFVINMKKSKIGPCIHNYVNKCSVIPEVSLDLAITWCARFLPEKLTFSCHVLILNFYIKMWHLTVVQDKRLHT